MKHSIFLFLLFLAFSTSDNFDIIKKPGIYRWEITENFNEISNYERFDLPNEELSSSNNDNSEQPYLGIPDSGISELGIVEQRMDTPNTSVQQRMDTPNTSVQQRMDTHNTYIILEIDKYYKFSLYYWVGAQSSEEKIINVTHSVGYMLIKIYKEMPEVKVRKFCREAEGAESVSFLTLFNLPHIRLKSRLYRVAGTQGQFIMEVPLTYNQLNGFDSFVLHNPTSVLIWNSLYSNEYKKYMANVFGNHIFMLKNMKTVRDKPMLVTEGFTDRTSKFYKRFKKEFFKGMKGTPENKWFPQVPYHYADKELENKRREEVKLYEFVWSSNVLSTNQVEYTDLKLNDLKINDVYVLADTNCGNTFVIIGRKASLEQIQESLYAAEKLSRSIEQEDAWQKVKVFRLGINLPVHFQIYFSDSSCNESLKINY